MSLPKQLPAALREIRLHLCQTSPSSSGVRQFISSNYSSIKKSHPDLKLMIREASGVEPRAFVRFDRGVEVQTQLSGLGEKDVGSAITKLLSSQTVGSA